jgi:hypothetical protein
VTKIRHPGTGGEHNAAERGPKLPWMGSGRDRFGVA